ncbi:MAG: hypothetical protein JNL60_13800 [Bacteroidia bacterium]|nr:hypothetical protein [Bacteroidia bacterium]
MKTKFFIASFAILSNYGHTQSTWNTNLNNGTSLKFGTSTSVPLDFYTNGTKYMSLDDHGKFTINGLSGSATGVVFVDQNGVLGRLPGSYSGGPCTENALPWSQGGNKDVGSNNTIGTCTLEDFILKAGNLNTIFIKSNSSQFVGIGPNNSSPSAALDVSDGQPNYYGSGTSKNHLTLAGDDNGAITSNAKMTLQFIDKFSIYENIQSSVVERFRINNGILSSYLPIEASGDIKRKSTTNATCKIITENSLGSYEFKIDNTGTGRISSGGTDYLNYKASLNNYPQVWIGGPGGGVKPIGTHADFSFAVSGKIVAQSIYVTAPSQTNWADYVFADDYKLLPLSEVEAYYKINKHLPEIPTTSEVKKDGIDIGTMNVLLLKKVEELTLYIVELNKKMQSIQEYSKSNKQEQK